MQAIHLVESTPGDIIVLETAAGHPLAASRTSMLLVLRAAQAAGRRVLLQSDVQLHREVALLAGWELAGYTPPPEPAPQTRMQRWAAQLRKEMYEYNLGATGKQTRHEALRAVAAVGGAVAVLGVLVLYAAVPDATVSIRPNVEIVSRRAPIYFELQPDKLIGTTSAPGVGAGNVTVKPHTLFKGKQQTPNPEFLPRGRMAAHLYRAELSLRRDMSFDASGKRSLGKKAGGSVTVRSTAGFGYQWKPGTRLQTAEGIVYRTGDWVTIPPRGTVQFPVVADDMDIFGALVGTRGNIAAGTPLTVPALKNTGGEITAFATDAFAGGEDSFERYITDQDIQLAQIKLQQALQAAIAEEFAKAFPTGDVRMLTEFGKQLWQYGEQAIVLSAAAGDRLPAFSGTATQRVLAYGVNDTELYAQLTAFAGDRAAGGQSFVRIEPQSASLEEYQGFTESTGTLRATVAFRAVNQHNIFYESPDYITELRQRIAGMGREEALRMISSQGSVADVDISLFPFWRRTLPEIPAAIHFRIVQ